MASATDSEPLSAEQQQADPRVLVFVHIPKAAGTSFSRILQAHYGEGFERIDQFRRDELQRAGGQGEPVSLELPHVRAVTGHLAFGLVERLFPEGRFITILRDPLERTLSQYEYMLHRAGRPWDHKTLPPPTRELTIGAAIEQGYVRDNLQTRMLCGLVSPHDPLSSGALDQARRNLAERFAYVGTTERFAEFLALLNLELGWPTVAYKRTRVTPARKPVEQHSKEDLRIVEEANALDRELVSYGEALFDRALERAGPDLASEVEVLQRALSIGRRAGKEAAPDAATTRALPLGARVALALKEAELARERELRQEKARKVKQVKQTSRRRAEQIRALKNALRNRNG